MSTPATNSMESFFTRQKANEGIELPLYLPDGTKSEHTLRIRGVDSDAFKEAEAKGRRRLLEAASEKNADKLTTASVVNREDMLSSLIIGWSFDQPCTEETKRHLLREAPQIADAIDTCSSRRSLFFKNGSVNSTPSPVPSSS